MRLYEILTHLTTTMGLTVEDAFDWVLIMALGVYGGCGFVLAMCVDFGRILWRLFRFLLRAILRPIRRRLKVHFQK